MARPRLPRTPDEPEFEEALDAAADAADEDMHALGFTPDTYTRALIEAATTLVLTIMGDE